MHPFSTGLAAACTSALLLTAPALGGEPPVKPDSRERRVIDPADIQDAPSPESEHGLRARRLVDPADVQDAPSPQAKQGVHGRRDRSNTPRRQAPGLGLSADSRQASHRTARQDTRPAPGPGHTMLEASYEDRRLASTSRTWRRHLEANDALSVRFEHRLARFDENGDGRLSAAEQRTAGARMNKHHQMLVTRMDANADGEVSLLEFHDAHPELTEHMQQSSIRFRQRMERPNTELVEQFDANEDGRLDKAERHAAWSEWRAGNIEMIALFDANEDGRLDNDETRAMMPLLRDPARTTAVIMP